MRVIAAAIITGDTLLKLVVGALVAGIGVMLAFSLLLYCTDRATSLRRADHRGQALVFRAASAIAILAICALVAYGLILTVSKPK